MRTSLLTTGMLGLLIALLLSACGTQNVGTLDPSGLDGTHGIAGVTLGDFEVVRYNANGLADPALNSTLELAYANGDSNVLTINVSDADFTTSVCVDVNYNAGNLHPVRAEFHNLVGGEGEAINAAILDHSGVAGLGEVAVRDFNPGNLDGAFATVYFENGPSRGVSAAGDPHGIASGVARVLGGIDNILVDNAPAGDPTTAAVTWFAGWHAGDGDQNSEVNIADLTPIGQNLNAKPFSGDASWQALAADYNCEAAVNANSEVNINDVTEIGRYFQQKTNEYFVQVSDNTTGAATTDVATIPWGTEQTPKQLGVDGVLNDMRTVFIGWTVDFVNDPPTGVDVDALTAIDDAGNQDHMVRLLITPRVTTPAGVGITVPVDIEVPGGTPPPTADLIQVKSIDIQVTGATATGGGNIFDATHLTGEVVANSTVSFDLNTISGSYTPVGGTAVDFVGLNLDAGTYPNFATNYNLALAAAVNEITWATTTGPGAAGFRRTGDWLNAGVVFPDDDPDSDTMSPEAHLNATLLKSGTNYLVDTTTLRAWVLPDDNNDLVLPVVFDVTEDADAATFTGYMLDGSDTNTEMKRPQASDLVIDIDWGGVDPAAIDLTTTQFQMLVLPPSGICDPNAGTTVDYAYEDFVVSPQDPSPELNAGEFTIEDRGGGVFQLHALTPGLFLVPDTDYIFRFNNTLEWSSVNRPDWTFNSGEPPPPIEVVSIPDAFGSGDEYNFLQIYPKNPIVHRWSSAEPDALNGTINYHGHEADFNDILKTDGTFISLEAEMGVGAWPSLVIVEGNITPETTILYNDPANLTGLFNVVRREFGRVVVDILSIPRPTELINPTFEYTYALFDRATTQIGAGHFTTELVPPTWNNLSAVDWGIDAWDREAGAYGTQDYSIKTLDGDTMGTATPDVMWFEWNGGFVNDWNYGFDEVTPTRNVRIYAEDTIPGSTMYMPIILKIVGITPSGNYIGIHPVSNLDYYNKWDPMWDGIFEPSHEYTLTLDDANGSGLQRLFNTGNLSVINSNPNG